MNRSAILAGVFAVMTMAPLAAAPVVIAVDEYGNLSVDGVLSQGYFSNDPGPGGLPNVLTYSLPFSGVQGDIELDDFCGCPSDIIRFNGDGTLIFYSENLAGFDSLADTPAPPGDSYANLLFFLEDENGVIDGFTYTPGAGDPGYDSSNPTFVFLSTGALPEPGSFTMIAGGLMGLAYLRLRRRRRAPKPRLG